MELDKALRYYYKAKELVYDKGYYYEIYWQEKQNKTCISKQSFLAEYAWVVLSSGMNEKVVRRKYNELGEIFCFWKNLQEILLHRVDIRCKALAIFNHKGKVDAIIRMVEYLSEADVQEELLKIEADFSYLFKFSFLGPATSLHLAKNLGFNISKPDRHLVRISKAFGYKSSVDFCKCISGYTGDKEGVVDVVLWRYATLNKKYLQS